MDHIVLNVSDVERAVRFYAQVLGLPTERLEAYREGKVPFPSVRVGADTVIDFFAVSGQGSAESGPAKHPNLGHFCLALEKADWDSLRGRLEASGVAIHIGPIKRWGARGNGTSIYFRDPEGNEIEARYYEEA
jgi:catechol 2,3-dioxygenase-like lactoylglutathione lyase family enzyme